MIEFMLAPDADMRGHLGMPNQVKYKKYFFKWHDMTRLNTVFNNVKLIPRP